MFHNESYKYKFDKYIEKSMIFHIVRYKSRHLSVTQDSILRYLFPEEGTKWRNWLTKKSNNASPWTRSWDPSVKMGSSIRVISRRNGKV